MGKEVDLLFNVPIGMPFMGLGEHEPLIIALFLPVVTHSNCRVTWIIQGSEWVAGTV